MKLDKKKSVKNIWKDVIEKKSYISFFIILCVYSLMFGISKYEMLHSNMPPYDIEQLLCVISGFPLTDGMTDDIMLITKWMLAIVVVYSLIGREIYNMQYNLKYMMLIRYQSYKKFYRAIMNRVFVKTILYGVVGVTITYVLYTRLGNGQVSDNTFFIIGLTYITNLVLLCMLQAVCMIVSQSITLSIVLMASWLVLSMCSHFFIKKYWIAIPVHWGMYVRTGEMIEGGVPLSVVGIQCGICLILLLCIPHIRKLKCSQAAVFHT